MASKFKPCTVAGCKRNAHYTANGNRGWCRRHYSRWLNHGDPLGGRPTFKGEPQEFLSDTVLKYFDDDCLIWPYARNQLGYGHINIDGSVHTVSRLVCIARHGPPPSDKHEAAHNCGNGHLGCVNPLHLRWATPHENQQDRVAHGTSNRGERAGLAKLTEEDVREIWQIKGTTPYPKIAEQFGVSASTISAIYNGYAWAWLQP